MKELERVILRLKTAKLSVKSEATKLLLEDCINDLTELDKRLFEEEQAKKIPPAFKIGDKVKFNPETVSLTEEGAKQRFLVNTIANDGQIWCVDVKGIVNPVWISNVFLMLADD